MPSWCGKFVTACVAFSSSSGRLYLALACHRFAAEWFPCCGTSASVAKMFSSVCLLFTSLYCPLNASVTQHIQVSYEAFVLPECPVLLLSSLELRAFYSLYLASDDFTFESREPRNCFKPGSLMFSSERYLLISTVNARSQSRLLSQEFPDKLFLRFQGLLDFISQLINLREHGPTAQSLHVTVINKSPALRVKIIH